ncbi:hypothetical protein G6F56_011209 [Rhizopus delemar]|nr:hypothetical protein G6F56_011209 [Rhizopus delemar]
MNRLLIKTNDDIGMFKDYHVCPRGCYLYPENSTNSQCPNPLCHLPRYVVQDGVTLPVPAAITSICSIGVALAEMLLDPNTSPLFDYRAAYEEAHEDSVYTDIFSGSFSRQTYLRNGLFENPSGVGLLIVVDGFQPKYHRNTTMTSIACYVMSLDPNERGSLVKKGDVTVEEGKVYLMSNTGDIPGIAGLMNHDGHMCKHGCRICDIMGEYAFHGYRFNKVGHLRTYDDLINGCSVLNMPGVPWIITSSATFSGFPFFAMDEMHLIGGEHGYCFELLRLPGDLSVMEAVAKYMHLSRATMPPCFEGCWESCFKNYRAVD